MGLTRDDEELKKPGKRETRTDVKEDKGIVERLKAETGVSENEAIYYLKLIDDGFADASGDPIIQERLSRRGMVILSGDGRRVLPVHPRLGLANQYRTWRENMIREMNERRMRMDKLILELIPVWEAATEKRTHAEGEQDP